MLNLQPLAPQHNSRGYFPSLIFFVEYLQAKKSELSESESLSNSANTKPKLQPDLWVVANLKNSLN